MTTLLQINSSINNGNGQSSRLADQFVAAFRERKHRVAIRSRGAEPCIPPRNTRRPNARWWPTRTR